MSAKLKNLKPQSSAPAQDTSPSLLRCAKFAMAETKAWRITAYLCHAEAPTLSLALDLTAPGKRELESPVQVSAKGLERLLADASVSAPAELRPKTLGKLLSPYFDGRSAPAVCWVYPVLDVNLVVGCMIMEFDRDARRKAEKAANIIEPVIQELTRSALGLQKRVNAQDALTLFLDATSDGIIIAHSSTQELLFLNETARRVLGKPEKVPASLTDFRPLRNAGAWTTMLQDLEQGGAWSGTLPLVTQDSSRIAANTFALRFCRNSQRDEWAIALIFRAAEDIRSNDARIQGVIDSLSHIGPHLYYVIDTGDKHLIAGYDGLADRCGIAMGDLTGKPLGWLEAFHDGDRPTLNRSLKKLLSLTNDQSETFRVRLSRPNGQWETVDVTHRVMERGENGAPLTMIGILQALNPNLEPSGELRRREAPYREMADEASDFIFICDPNGIILHSNEHIERMTGYKQQDVVGRSLWTLLELPESGRFTPELAAIDRQRLPRVTCQLQCRSGGTVVVDLRLRRLSEQRYLGIARDVSREVAIADATTRQAAYYRGLFQHNISGVAVFDEALQIIAVNPALCRLLHRREKNLLNTSIFAIVAPECLGEAREAFHRMRHDRRFNQRFRTGFKLTLLRNDFTPIYTQTSLSAVSDGIVLFYQGIAIFTDITDETRLRDERDQQARLNEALFTDAPNCIIVTDPNGIVIRVNPAVEELTGYPAKHFVGKSFRESCIIDPKGLPSTLESWRDQLLKGRRVHSSLRVFSKNEEVRIVDAQSTTAIGPDGKLLCIITTAADVTEQRRLESEVIKIAEEAQMRIGHDLHDGVGQVLTGIMSLTEALESGLEGAALRDTARIRNLVREAIHQVRDLSHTLSPAAVKNRGLAAALRLLATQVKHRKMDCVCNIEAEPIIQDADKETHVYRIAQEAVNNALKHGKPRQISIHLKRLSDDRCLMIIQDDGIGISPRKAKRRGGIGVRVMSYRANLIGGELDITPSHQGGTEVSCRFPCAY